MHDGENPIAGKFQYIFPLKDQENSRLYHYIKGRNEIAPNEVWINNGIIPEVVSQIGPRKVVIIPESSCNFIRTIADQVADQVVVVKKRAKSEVRELLSSTFSLQKGESARFDQSFGEMGESFRLNRIKGNQRWRFADIMFDWDNVPEFSTENAIILDDSLFSGYTAKFIKEKLGVGNTIVIFSKW